jgi:uncharacterized coiled-coil DUF342 family protein
VALDLKAAIEKLATNTAEALKGVSSSLDSHDQRLKAVENYQKRLDAAAKKRVTTERAKEMKEGESGE